MHFYKIILSYKGTNYFGWQVQQESQITIQGELNKALAVITKSSEVSSVGSGRTDAGVHALNQVCRVEIPLDIPPDALVRALNANLPKDIRIKSAVNCDKDFHPIFSAKEKEYIYLFTNIKNESAFQRDLLTNINWDLDFEKMKKACSLFVGEHDFQNFYCLGTDISSTKRQIYSCELVARQNNQVFHEIYGDYWQFSIRGSGFLKQMVRLIIGSLWELGKGNISEEDLKKYLSGTKYQNKIGPVAPPQGLYLSQVFY